VNKCISKSSIKAKAQHSKAIISKAKQAAAD
jgi:hypothetical protein